MYFTEPSPYLEDTYFGKFASYPKHRFKNEDELYITAVSMIDAALIKCYQNNKIMSTNAFHFCPHFLMAKRERK